MSQRLIATPAFDDAAKLLGVQTGNPGLCWLLDQVLGIQPNTVAEYGMYTDGYLHIDRANGNIERTFTPWTDEQLDLLEEWKEHLTVA